MGHPTPTPSTFMEYVQTFANSPRINCNNLFPNKKHYEESLAVLLGVNSGIKNSEEFIKNARKNYAVGVRQSNGRNIRILVQQKSRKELLCWEDLKDVLMEFHDNGGHSDRNVTLKKILDRFYFVPAKLVQEYINNYCNICKTQPKQEPDLSLLKSQNDSLNHTQQTQMSFAVAGDSDYNNVKVECQTPPPGDNEISKESLSSFGDDSHSQNKENVDNRNDSQPFGNNNSQVDSDKHGESDGDEDDEPGRQNSFKIKIVNVESRGGGSREFQHKKFKKIQTHTSSSSEESDSGGSRNEAHRDNNSTNDQQVEAINQNPVQPDFPDRNTYCGPSIKQTRLNRQLALSIAVAEPLEKIHHDNIIKLIQICDPEIEIPERDFLEEKMNDLVLEIKAEMKKILRATNTITFSFEMFGDDLFLAVLATYYDTTQRKKRTMVLAVRRRQDINDAKYELLKQDILLANGLQEWSTKSLRFVTDFCTVDERLLRDVSKYLRNFKPWGKPRFHPWCPGSSFQHFSAEPGDCILCTGDKTHFLHSLLQCAHMVFINRDVHADTKNGIRNIIKSTENHVKAMNTLNVRLIPLTNLTYGELWKDIFMSLDNILIHRSKLTELGVDEVSKALNNMNWAEANKLHSFLQPFNSYTDLYGDEGPTCVSEIVVIIRQLETHLKKFQGAENYRKMVTEMLSELNKQFDHIFNPMCRGSRCFDGVFLASTLLDPRFRKVLKIGEIFLAKQYITSLQTDQNSISNSNTAANGQNEEPPTKKRKYECLNAVNWENIGPLNIDGELESYIHNNSYDTKNDELNPWKFWQEHETSFPKLAPIALDVLSVPLLLSEEECISLSKSNNYHLKPNESDQEFERRILLTWNKSLLTI